MKSNEYPKGYNKQVDHYAALMSIAVSSSSPEIKIACPPTSYQLPTFQSDKHISPEVAEDSHIGDADNGSNAEQGRKKCDIPLIEAVFDGACEPRNPGGHGSYGSVVRINGYVVYRNGGYCGYGRKMSNNVAEYCGAIDALTEAVKHEGKITLRGDSKLVLMQLGPDPTLGRKRWKARAGLYLPYYEKALALVEQHRGRIRFQWIPRKHNTDCDELSKKVLRDRDVSLCIQPEQEVTGHQSWQDDGHQPWGGAFNRKRSQKSKKGKRGKVNVRRSHKRKGATDFNKKGGQC